MRLIDADALKRRAQKVAAESWKMHMTAKVEKTLNQFIDWIDQADTAEPEFKWTLWTGEKISEMKYGLCQEDRIRCPECGYITSPQIAKWDGGDHTIGQIVLPYRCPSCFSDMRGWHND